MTYIITFRSRRDAILMQEYLAYKRQNSVIQNASGIVNSVCSVVLKVPNTSFGSLINNLQNSNVQYSNIYLEKESHGLKNYLRML